MTAGVGACLALAAALALDPEGTFEAANSAYDAGQYSAAARLYGELIAAGYGGGWMHYNRGNSLLRGDALGPAIAAYRQSAAALPRQGDVAANLAYARQRTADAVPPPEPGAGWRRAFFWHFACSPEELLALTAALSLAFWGLMGWRHLRPQLSALDLPAWVLGALFLAVGSSAALRQVWPEDVAVVIPAEVDVHSGTDRNTVVRFKLHAGAEAAVRDAHAGWLRIELGDGKQGWLAEQDVERLRL